MQEDHVLVEYLPIIIQAIVAIGFVVTTITVSHFVGPKRYTKIKNESWECGIDGEGDARAPISVKYFLVAILFVLFDVEVIFMYPWAVNFREFTAAGWDGFLSMLLFLALLLTGFFYVIKKGALKWD